MSPESAKAAPASADPVWQAVDAPVVSADSEYECDEEREQVEEARSTMRFIPGEQVSAEIAARRDREG